MSENADLSCIYVDTSTSISTVRVSIHNPTSEARTSGAFTVTRTNTNT